jgi:hypothetical protein
VAAKKDRKKKESERAILPIIESPLAGRRRLRGSIASRVDVSLEGKVRAGWFTASGRGVDGLRVVFPDCKD